MARAIGWRVVGVVATWTAFAAGQTSELFLDVPIHVETPVGPMTVRGDDGKLHASYHLFLTNGGDADLVLDRVQVLDADSKRPLATCEAAALRQPSVLHLIPFQMPTAATARHLPSGRTAALKVWLTFESDEDVPEKLVHRFEFAPQPALRIAGVEGEAKRAPLGVTCAPLAVSAAEPIVLGPPLTGGPWFAAGAAGPLSHHFGVAFSAGRARMPERFAIDFQKVDARGDILPNPFPNDIENTMFYANRAEVLAVADGVVVLARDGIPENKPTPSGDENMPVPLTPVTIAGNLITVDLGGGRFAHYAHLVPGSLRVKVGDRVTRGQPIALIGNSGNSKNPHLHFEVSDGPELNSSEGLPYVFEEFGLYGHKDPRMPRIDGEPERRSHEVPLYGAVMRFPH
jgi:murein DD-endopeptidase MepM/ murein hydrolase activator NlpD